MICDKFSDCKSSPQNKDGLCEVCRQEKNDSTIKCEEHKKKYYLSNKAHTGVVVFHVDGGVVKEESACDYLLWVSSMKRVYFVELKGTDVSHGLKQIEKSVGDLIHFFPDTQRYGRIVCRAVPRITNTGDRVTIEKRLRENYGMDLKIGEKELTDAL